MSYERGRILIATEQAQKIEGMVELVEYGEHYLIRVEEDDSFWKVESSKLTSDSISSSKEENYDKNKNFDDVETEKYDDVEKPNIERDHVATGGGPYQLVQHLADCNTNVPGIDIGDHHSQVPKMAYMLESEIEESSNVIISNSSQGLDSIVEDSMGLTSLFHHTEDVGVYEGCVL